MYQLSDEMLLSAYQKAKELDKENKMPRDFITMMEEELKKRNLSVYANNSIQDIRETPPQLLKVYL